MSAFPPLGQLLPEAVQLPGLPKLPLVDEPLTGSCILRRLPPETLQPAFQQRMSQKPPGTLVGLWCEAPEQGEIACELPWIDALIVEYNPFVPQADEELFWRAQQVGKAIWVRNPDGLEAPETVRQQRLQRWDDILADFPEFQQHRCWLASAFVRHPQAVTTLLYRQPDPAWEQALALPSLDQAQSFRVKRRAVGLDPFS